MNDYEANPVYLAIIRAMDAAEELGATRDEDEYIAIMRAVANEALTRAHNAENA